MTTDIATTNGTGTGTARKKEDRLGKQLLVEIVVEGKSPLLMDCMSDEDIEHTLIRKERKPPVTDKPLNEMCNAKIYRHPETNQIVVPATVIIGALKNAGKKVKVGRGGITNGSGGTELFSFLTLEEEYYPLQGTVDSETKEVAWKVDLRKGNMGTGPKTTAVGIVRPKFEHWSLKVTMNVDLDGMEGITLETVRKLVEIAGLRVGIGSYRPQKGGPFGRFTVKEWNVRNAD